MRNTLILAVLSVFVWGCSSRQFPADPNIKKHYLLEIKDEPIKVQDIAFIEDVSVIPELREPYRCLEFDITSWQPYKIKYVAEVSPKQCNLTGGYRPSDIQQILNWIDDVYSWYKDRKRCIKL